MKDAPNRLQPAEAMEPARRLEELWRGVFGTEYTSRNADAGRGRDQFWSGLLSDYPVGSVLEVGSNIGANLQWIRSHIKQGPLVGVDVNEYALTQLRARTPAVSAVVATSRGLPFRDAAFDLVFTAGVLIHHPPQDLAEVMLEIVRCARRYVLCLEYFAEGVVEVPYRGHRQALFKQDFGARYLEVCPALHLIRTDHLARHEGWDDVTVWLFEKSCS